MARRRGGDKYFQRNKEKEKKDFHRGKANRELIKSIIIACEDSVSSRIYFQMLIDKLIKDKKITPNSSIIVPHDGATHPTGVLENLKNYRQHNLSWKDFEYKWIVIDRDKEYQGGGHTAEDFNNALNNAPNTKNNLHIDVAYANDSFEIWYLLHFEYRTTAIMRDQLIAQVIKKLKEIEPQIFSELNKDNIKNKNYSKDIFKVLLKLQDTAITNAKKLLQSYENTHNPEKDNPSTTIHELVLLLKSLK